MKKLVSLILVAGTCALISCGPSKEEQEAAAKATADSIAQVEAQKAMEDSMAMVEKAMQDSIAAAQKATQDSLTAKMEQMEKKMNAKPPVKSNKQKEEEDRKKQAKEKG
jgi:hypothetical protein